MSESSVSRIAKLAGVMQADGIDAFFACTPISMGYLMGLHEDGHERLLILAVSSTGAVRLICPALTATQAKRTGIEDIRPWADGENPMALIEALADDWNLRSGIIAVDSQMRADILLGLQETLPAALFKPGSAAISQLMRQKDESEVALMKKAADIADEAYKLVKPKIKVGMTEIQVAKLLVDAMAGLGGKPTFCIVAAGPNGAEPHHLNDDTVLTEGDVVILDFGCDVGGYQSDITRTVAMGSASDKAKLVYETVFKAHQAARSAANVGTAMGDIDAAARGVIEAAGFGPYFFHRTGHGIGMQGHEDPNVTPGSDFKLEAGNCFSVEPGIYLAGEFGVRIENIVMSKAEGCWSFNVEPSPNLEILR
ncbi:MAG: hypothetical protein BGO01_18760 [Armatimonadetes bacterium 55-13]|nr:aminopeptidase P family protein [Armatimonadota bacterium]ODU54108.1 MAG: hypothetical protein ABT09_00190 [bacterium SCN 57-13]OJU64169.1 MAG: hypothetical protein BGO01_18760 [Armatimonadetes bacterium 55-13]